MIGKVFEPAWTSQNRRNQKNQSKLVADGSVLGRHVCYTMLFGASRSLLLWRLVYLLLFAASACSWEGKIFSASSRCFCLSTGGINLSFKNTGWFAASSCLREGKISSLWNVVSWWGGWEQVATTLLVNPVLSHPTYARLWRNRRSEPSRSLTELLRGLVS